MPSSENPDNPDNPGNPDDPDDPDNELRGTSNKFNPHVANTITII